MSKFVPEDRGVGAWENRGGEGAWEVGRKGQEGVLKGREAGEIGRDLNSTMLDISNRKKLKGGSEEKRGTGGGSFGPRRVSLSPST